MQTIFGPAGIPLSTKGDNITGITESLKMGLKAYEIEFVRGARMNPDTAKEISKIAKESSAKVSCHAPYYINCSNLDKYGINERNLLEPIKIGQALTFSSIVFHTGYAGTNRENSLKNCIQTLKKINEKAENKKYTNYTLGPETSGKKAQIGTVQELITICKEIKQAKPVIDWAHIHAISNGGLKDEKDFTKVIENIENELGKQYIKGLHCHYSEIEYGLKGEIRHQPLGSKWGPDFTKLAKAIKQNDYEFTIICESPLIEQDALKMQDILQKII